MEQPVGCIPFLQIRSASILLAYSTREQDAHTTDRLFAKLGCSPACKALDKAYKEFKIAQSDETYQELNTRIYKRKFDKYISDAVGHSVIGLTPHLLVPSRYCRNADRCALPRPI